MDRTAPAAAAPASRGGLTVVTLLQRADGTFERVTTNLAASNDLQACGDVDGDGIPDLAHDFDHDGVPDLAVSGSPNAAFRGTATAPFAEQHSIPVVREALQLEACDIARCAGSSANARSS